MDGFRTAALAIILVSIVLLPNASALLAFMDRTVYIVGDEMVFKVNRTAGANITAVIYNSTADNVSEFTIPSGQAGFAEYEHVPSTDLDAGIYSVILDQDGDEVNMTFEVVAIKLETVVRLMGAEEPIFVNTSTPVVNRTGPWGTANANFTDLFGLNKTAGFYVGTCYDNLSGDNRNFTFVTVDENEPGIHDRVYVDDDMKFEFYNDSEDTGDSKFTETGKKPGDMLEIDANHRFIIADVDAAGEMVYLIVPPSGPAYAPGDMLYMVVIVMDQGGEVYPGQDVSIEIHDESKVLQDSDSISIGEQGYVNISFNLTGYVPGKYYILANGTPVDVFKVESFNLQGKVTDIDGNPMSSFAPGSEAKVWVVSKDGDGDLQDLDAVPEGTLVLPDGTVEELVFEEVPNTTGVYTAEIPESSAAGEYKVVIEGSMASESDKVDMGMKVKALDMMVMTLNPKYMDEGPGEGSMVDTFAPNSNITAAVFLLNNSMGSGFMSGGPPCGSDDEGSSCVRTDCNASQFKVSVKDESGQKHKLVAGENYTVKTIAAAAQSFGMNPPNEPGIPQQCMIIIYANNSWSNKTGNYKLDVEFSNASLGDLRSGQSFNIERLLASGSTVDFKGDSFSFFAPNSTVRVKIEIRNMVTDELLSASDILSAKFTSMWKEWPSRENALTEMNFSKELLNESMDGDKIVFTSPPEEGFYTADFRFAANVSGEKVEGTGRIFFELKKYMIWANLDSAGGDSFFARQGEEISLVVNVMDIDMGSMYGQEGVTQSCTNCEGLIATVGSLRNEQFFKEMQEDTDYSVETGVIVNSTSGATITINPVNLPSGWYGVDIMLQNPETGEEFFGWGGFEIRNFWVDVFEAEEIDEGGPYDGNYTRAGEGGDKGGSTVESGGSVVLGVAAFSPPTKNTPPGELSVSGVSVKGLQNDMVWPPVAVDSSKYTVTGLGEVNMLECYGEDMCNSFPMYLINLSVSDTLPESSYRLNLEVTTPAGSDVGTAWLTVSTYIVDKMTVPESKMYEFPPVYASTEDITLLFAATDFAENPHNITNVTVSEVFAEKMGRPLKFRFGQNYTNDCTGNTSECNLTIMLSTVTGLETGYYNMRLEVEDNDGGKQTDEFSFEIRNMLFAVPKMYEGWTRDYATSEQTLNAWYAEDSCENQVPLQSEMDACRTSGGTVVCPSQQDQMDEYGGNLTIPDEKDPGTHYHYGRICFDNSSGCWGYAISAGAQCQGSQFAFVVSNGTNLWIGNTTDLSSSTPLYENSTFALSIHPELTWVVEEMGGSANPGYAKIKLDDGICGRSYSQGGDMYNVVPPAQHVNHTTFYHGPAYLVGNIWQSFEQSCQQNQYDVRCSLNATDRPAYIYHNTTHLWIYPSVTGTINFTDGGSYGPYSVGQTFDDGSGGMWKVTTISKGIVEVAGQNILSDGLVVNVSLSVSGRVYIGQVNENEMGQQNKMAGSIAGLDLDGDGYTNGTFYFIVLDSVTGYDNLAYAPDISQKWNFSELIDVNDANRTLRLVGNADQLTLLSIDPRATRVKFYDSEAIGDWPELGDAKIGANVTIPVIVRSPSGTPITANVSIDTIKKKTSQGTDFIQLGGAAIRTVVSSGIGEIRVNVSDINNMGAGSYEFGLSAENNTVGYETLNEWMWPRTTVRNFLIDSSAGYGGLATGFASMSVTTYGGWGSSAMVYELEGRNGIDGVFAFVNRQVDPATCPDMATPYGVIATENRTYVLDRIQGAQYFVYYYENNATTFWLKQGNCNFSVASNYTAGQPLNLSVGSDLFMLYVLNSSHGYSAIGLSDFDSMVIEPVTNSSDNDYLGWSIMSVNLSGVSYNIVFANDTNLEFPQAATWHQDRVAKAAWFSTSYNFSSTVAQKKVIGDNITGNLYLARMGPDAWSGIGIADSSNLSSVLGINENPGIDIRVQDGAPVYFGVIDESDPDLGTDVNMNNDTTDVFYMVAFDDFPDGSAELSRIFVDDDLNITEPWWSDSNDPGNSEDPLYYDFYGNESGEMSEQEGGVPRGMWGGNVRFGANNDSLPWEENPSWNVKNYNGTNMMLEKNDWQMDLDKNITLTVKAFDFTQAPLIGANVSIGKVMRFGGGQPYAELNRSLGNYSLIEVQNVTDSKGYAMLKMVPPAGGWLSGAEYIANLNVVHGGRTETTTQWFRVGGQ